ncbi:MAG: DUF401 family protein [Candidatus Bathyarchaeia archaeon]
MLDPLVSVLISFCLLGIMLYRRVRLGIALMVTPIVLALLAFNWIDIPELLYATIDPSRQEGLLALLVILATFVSSWFSYLYKETKEVLVLSEGLSNLVRKPKIILFFLPAIIGLIPVPGGALLSAPIVDSESKSLNLSSDKKAYINLWFRHIIFPIYPLTQSLIVAAALTSIPLLTILLLQIPVITVMAAVGYLLGLKGASSLEGGGSKASKISSSGLASFMSFLPILIAVALAVILGTINHILFQQGLNVVIASFAGLLALAAISRSSFRIFIKPLANLWVYDITFATYGAFLLQNVIKSINIAGLFRLMIQNGVLSEVWILMIIPVCLGFLTGSPMGAIAITASIFSGLSKFSPGSAALLYASAYLGYIIAPTHLCFVFTVDYFKSSLAKVYGYIIPSFIITYSAALLLYFLI